MVRASIIGVRRICWVAGFIVSTCTFAPSFGQNIGGRTMGSPTGAPQARRFPLEVIDIAPLTGPILVAHPEELAALQASSAVVLTSVLLPDGSAVSLSLQQLDLAELDLGIRIDGARASNALDGLVLSIWGGKVIEAPGASVFVAFSRAGSWGWVEMPGETFHLVSEPNPDGDWTLGRSRWRREHELATQGKYLSQFCSADRLPRAPLRASNGAPPAPGAILVCKVAIEGDYQLFQAFGDASAELSYVTALLAAVSYRYRGQLDVLLTYPYLNLWTISADPWMTPDIPGTTLDMLFEFQNAWAGNIPGGGNLAHFLSGADLGGGIAYLDVLCDQTYGFAVSANLTSFGQTPFPVAPGPLNWDFFVIAHELGHNFSAIHTHEECPPLDECAPAGYFGPCQTSQACTSQGTIMSYCHLCSGGTSNITTFLHTAQLPGMRSAAENSCLMPFKRNL